MIVNKSYFEEVKNETLFFLDSLGTETEFKFLPVKRGLLQAGEDLSLGFSCYSLKIKYILGDWEILSQKNQQEWIKYINSFQKEFVGLPQNSYVDEGYIKNIKKLNFTKISKNFVKSSLNTLNIKKFESANDKIMSSIRAESKQAISTLFQVGGRNLNPYLHFPRTDKEILKFLNNLDWNYPWHAGAQFSALCVFTKTQDFDNKSSETLKKFADKLVDYETGCYFSEKKPNNTELINGAMKMLTGFDWLDMEIHYPEKLIDICLSISPQSEGCDIVDIIYVLHQSSKETNHRKKEVIKYLNDIVNIIDKHRHTDTGGFSYHINKSQTTYYGVKFSKGLNTADIHGTLLLVWALSMVKNLSTENNEWNTLKP